MEKSKKLAHYEIEWWKAHHRREKDKFIDSMSNLYSLQFNIDYDVAKKSVLLRVEAADWHDKAEKFEGLGDQKQADIFWDKAEECLYKHFEILENNI